MHEYGYTVIPFVILSRGRFIMLPFTDVPPSVGGASVNGNIIKRPRDRIPKAIRVYGEQSMRTAPHHKHTPDTHVLHKSMDQIVLDKSMPVHHDTVMHIHTHFKICYNAGSAFCTL